MLIISAYEPKNGYPFMNYFNKVIICCFCMICYTYKNILVQSSVSVLQGYRYFFILLNNEIVCSKFWNGQNEMHLIAHCSLFEFDIYIIPAFSPVFCIMSFNVMSSSRNTRLSNRHKSLGPLREYKVAVDCRWASSPG